MDKRAVHRLNPDRLAEERLRAAALREVRSTTDMEAQQGELWSIRPEIVDRETGKVLERSWAPVIVAVWRDAGAAFEVIPVSFEIDLTGPGDAISQEHLFERPYVLECWLRLPVLKEALHRRFGRVATSTWKRVEEVCASDRLAPQNTQPDEARAAYRQSERLRVLFAAAGAVAALSGQEKVADDQALRQKRTWGERQAALIEDLRHYHRAPSPSTPTGRVPTPA